MATRYFALIAGIIYALLGVLGFFPGLRGAPGMEAPELAVETNYGFLLGLFPVNILHNFVHLAIGVWGLASYGTYAAAKGFAKGLAIIYGILAIMGLIPGLDTVFGLIPIFGNDIWLHAVTALIAAYFGWGTSEPETATAT